MLPLACRRLALCATRLSLFPDATLSPLIEQFGRTGTPHAAEINFTHQRQVFFFFFFFSRAPARRRRTCGVSLNHFGIPPSAAQVTAPSKHSSSLCREHLVTRVRALSKTVFLFIVSERPHLFENSCTPLQMRSACIALAFFALIAIAGARNDWEEGGGWGGCGFPLDAVCQVFFCFFACVYVCFVFVLFFFFLFFLFSFLSFFFCVLFVHPALLAHACATSCSVIHCLRRGRGGTREGCEVSSPQICDSLA